MGHKNMCVCVCVCEVDRPRVSLDPRLCLSVQFCPNFSKPTHFLSFEKQTLVRFAGDATQYLLLPDGRLIPITQPKAHTPVAQSPLATTSGVTTAPPPNLVVRQQQPKIASARPRTKVLIKMKRPPAQATPTAGVFGKYCGVPHFASAQKK